MRMSSKQFLAKRDSEDVHLLRDKIMDILLISLLLLGLIFFLYISFPWGLLVVGILTAISIGFSRKEDKRMNEIAKQRKDENICAFTRALSYREIDTYIIRAVYEHISSFVPFPLRPSDRLIEEIIMDEEDLSESVFGLAGRVKRSMNEQEKNPLYGKVFTVEDLIMFLQQQSKI